MNKNILLILLVVIAVPLGIFLWTQYPSKTSPQPQVEEQNQVIEAPPDPQNFEGTYKGNLPCADCESIDATLNLSALPGSNTQGSYSLQYIYVGKEAQPLTEEGSWIVSKGDSQDPNANVIELIPSTEGAAVTFYKVVSQNTLQILDSNKGVIDSPSNQNLTKVQ